MARSVDFYLALGFDVSRVADGWALLRRSDSEQVVLVASRGVRERPAPVEA